MALVSKELQHQLIDHDHLQQQLAALPSSQVLKAALQAGQSQLDDIFQEYKEKRINELILACGSNFAHSLAAIFLARGSGISGCGWLWSP